MVTAKKTASQPQGERDGVSGETSSRNSDMSADTSVDGTEQNTPQSGENRTAPPVEGEPAKAEEKQRDPDAANPLARVAMAPQNREPMADLKPGHTYEDRVKAQADALGIEYAENETMEALMWKIRMKASS